MGDVLLGALALMLVFEGLLPFLSPGTWRQVFERATRLSDGQIRFVGLASLLAGLLLLALWRTLAGPRQRRRRSVQCRFQQRCVFPMSRAWLLPEHIADVLPSQARRIEELRRTLLDGARSYGFELVMPPLLEHLESLLSGTGTRTRPEDLQAGRSALRPHARPACRHHAAGGAHRCPPAQPRGRDAAVLLRPGAAHAADGAQATREPLQFGAEIYGHAGLEADLEVIDLALDGLHAAGVDDVVLDLGDARIVRAVLGWRGASMASG